jgi:Fe-S-cluster containining protein
MSDHAHSRTESHPRIDADLVRAPLQALYAELDSEIASLAPVCVLSGRCCRFQEYDHTLFLSEAEAAVLIADAPPPTRPLDEGATCPWQDEHGRCGARNARPLGCRVYFCDPNFDGHAEPLTERYLARIRLLVDELGLPWNYARLHSHLHAAVASGRLRIAGADHGFAEAEPDGPDAVPSGEALDISPSDQ